ncbi:MAG TPA: glutathione S-transferase N-terminal domain-containing protein [Solirubrobacteraceae bacterium]|nr:glutathione S-transferase N-terminal domain-containing protein [Solirubrobacteraceae bacterium]
MILYTCPFGTIGAPLHPCGKAAKALDDAGITYETRKVKGGSLMLWTWLTRAQDRAEIERLSGQRWVPILVLDDGAVITGSGSIVTWAREHVSAKV